jgi:hypothetical protein
MAMKIEDTMDTQCWPSRWFEDIKQIKLFLKLGKIRYNFACTEDRKAKPRYFLQIR